MGLVVIEGDVARKASTEDLAEAAYALISLVPPGRVVSYRSIAELLGVSPRLVGYLMKKNRKPLIVPCHRVVGSDGGLVGYSLGGLGVKRRLLEIEGVRFCGGKVCKEHFYDLRSLLGR